MKVSNIKNIVISALIFINLFFLVIYLLDIYSGNVNRANTLRDLSDLFGQSGVTLDTSGIREGAVLPEYSVSRDPYAEQALANTLLGPTTQKNEGDIYTYTGDKGQAVFKSGGELDCQLNPGAWPGSPDAVSAVKRLLKATAVETASLTVSDASGSETVSAVCSVDGLPAFNCIVDFVFTNGDLSAVSGRYPAGPKKPAGNSEMTSAETALVKFLGKVKSGEIPCTKISAADPGYNYEASDPAGGRFIAVWRITTDQKVYYVDADTGKIHTGIE